MTLPQIRIATPIYGTPENGQVHYQYLNGVRKLERTGRVKLIGDHATSHDLVHGRNRLAWSLMQQDDWDWVLWWDCDVVASDVDIVWRMVEAAQARDALVIGAPYPRKSIPARFPYRPMPDDMREGKLPIVDHCIQIQAIGLGFTMMHRKCLDAMYAKYADRWYCDTVAGKWVEMVDLFGQVTTEVLEAEHEGEKRRFRELLNEDYSFFYRWNAIEGKTWMYVGPGSPLAHAGPHLFTAGPHEIGSV